MSLDARPAPTPFDLEGGEAPPALDDERMLGPGAPPVLLVVVGRGARSTGWAARATVAIVRHLAGGRSVVLADLSMDRPELHDLLGVSNLEGLPDIFLFGASVARVAQAVPGEPFELVAAGSYVPDAREIVASPRWERIAEEYRMGGATLVAFVPADAPGVEELAGRMGAALVLAEPEEADAVAGRLPESCTVHGILTPARDVEEAADRETGAELEPRPPLDDLSTPPVLRQPGRRRRTSRLLLVLLLVLLAVAAWYFYKEYMAGSAEPAPAEPVTTEAAAPAEPARTRGEPAGAELGVSVNVAIYQSYEMARDRLDELRRGEPSVGFYLSPFEQDGVRYYRLQAGPAADPAGGRALLRRLYDAGQITAMEDYAVRPTTWAFRIGDYDTLDAARARQRTLAEQGVPCYVVEIPYTSGPSRYRLYGGAYEYRAEAQAMAALLEASDIEAELVERTGRPIV